MMQKPYPVSTIKVNDNASTTRFQSPSLDQTHRPVINLKGGSFSNDTVKRINLETCLTIVAQTENVKAKADTHLNREKNLKHTAERWLTESKPNQWPIENRESKVYDQSNSSYITSAVNIMSKFEKLQKSMLN